MHGCCKGVSLLILESYNECQYSSKVMGIIMHTSVTCAIDPSVNKALKYMSNMKNYKFKKINFFSSDKNYLHLT
jgi:hypothetical protein